MTRPKNSNPTPTVHEVGKMNFQGHIIPHTWYRELTFANGKPHLNAISILSDIVYWHRPTEETDEATGKLLGYKRKFWGDLLQRTYESFSDQFGMSKGQAQAAIKYLEDQGLITRVFRTVKTDRGTLYNVLFIDLHVDRLKEVTYPVLEEPLSGSDETPPTIEADTSLDETPDITEITTEITTEISSNITHHHCESESGGGAKPLKEKEEPEEEGIDRQLKKELILLMLPDIAPTFNNAKSFVDRLSTKQLDGLGAWLMLLRKDLPRREEINNAPGFLQHKMEKMEFPDEEYAWELWRDGLKLFRDREKDTSFDTYHDLYRKLRMH